MASGTLSNPISGLGRESTSTIDINSILWNVLRALGSLRITVWGFGLAIIIIFVGTLAQDEATIVDVKNEYFNSWLTKIPFDVFKPITIWPPDVFGRWSGSIPFPGGATIGLVLLVNLIAAKLTRFHMVAKGATLIAGLAFCLVGATITAVVILSAHAEDGLQGEPQFWAGLSREQSYEMLWQICRWVVWLTTIASAAWFVIGKTKTSLAYWTLFAVTLLLGLWSLAWLFYGDELRIPNPGLRIVWQMSKSLIAGTILLVGLTLLFGIRGGNVLIHLAVGLLMLGQFVFGDRQIEERITISDGESTNVAIRPDELELALIDSSAPEKDHVVAIDARLLRQSQRYQKQISDAAIPFKILVRQFWDNATLERASQTEKSNIATTGLGLQWIAKPIDKFGGAVEKRENNPTLYVEIRDAKSDRSLGVFLVTSLFSESSARTVGLRPNLLDDFEVDGKKYSLAIRNRRTYKDYAVVLKEAQRVNYSGTAMAKDYSSFVNFTDQKGRDVLDARIWMNNPVRFQGETFYQSGFYPAGSEVVEGKFLPNDTTVLQVVTNAGWLMPYIACAFAGLGMFAHFGGTFLRFASRFDRERTRSISQAKSNAQAAADDVDLWRDARASRHGVAGWLLPLLVVFVVGAMFANYARPKTVAPDKFDWYAAGKIPMQHEGRIKPLDTVARNVLQALSGSTSTLVRGEDDPSGDDAKYSATQWYFGVISGAEWVEKAKIFRIDAKEVLDIFELNPEASGGTLTTYAKLLRHSLKHRYSLAQLEPRMKIFQEKYAPLRERLKNREPIDSFSFAEKKIVELNEKLNIYSLNRFVNSTVNFPVPPASLKDKDAIQRFLKDLQEGKPFKDEVEIRNFLNEAVEGYQMVESMRDGQPAAMIPPIALKPKEVITPEEEKRGRWQALRPAKFDEAFGPLLRIESIAESQAIKPAEQMIKAAAGTDAAAFNSAVRHYQSLLGDLSSSQSTLDRASFEAWYNSFGPFNGCVAFYIIAFILTLLSYVVLPQGLRRTAYWMVAVVFVVHFLSIIARVYMTGKAPVTTLYSSAVFIGCGAVLIGLIAETLFPIRIGLLIGSVIGSTTLLVSWGLEKNDTMPVLEAVLDTQFWLTTHVQCITFGYVATFFAGFLGVFAILHRLTTLFGPKVGQFSTREAEVHRILIRLLYGTICVATFFSFIGTVLGGLWADDSWGRFWGWDPKENGALMIVLWNAILLHARWDKLVREPGIALLAVGGNIITAWSWFGTNQLGIGLHSYGFTSTVLQILGWFVVSQLAFVILGFVLLLMSRRTNEQAAPTTTSGSWE